MTAAVHTRGGRAVSLVKWALLALALLFAADLYHHPEKFRIKKVELHGTFARIDAAHIERALRGAQGGNYFLADTAAVAARVEQLPWVYRAAVRRKWPGTLVVEVDEVRPVARWGDGEWLHVDGELTARMPGAAEVLPQLSGPPGGNHAIWRAYQKWARVFAAAGVELRALHFDERGLWQLQLAAGGAGDARILHAQSDAALGDATLQVTLSQRDADARIARFARALRGQLLADFARMRRVDLRYPNGFAVDWRAPAGDAQLARAAEQGESAW